MPKKYTISFIKDAFEREGYILLSQEYINSSKRLLFLCSKGHKHSISWDNFKQGHRCSMCAKRTLLTFDYILDYFTKVGYTLLSKEYIPNVKLLYECNYGHTNSIIWGNFQQGERCMQCTNINKLGNNNPSWRGGVSKNNLPLYNTFVPQLDKYHKIYKVIQGNLELLGVECTYCNQIFVPTLNNVFSRIRVIKGNQHGEANFYCSDNCRQSCPTYKKSKYPKGFAPVTSREVQPELRKMVLFRDNYKCQICNKGLEDEQLHCHHITGVKLNPIESADIDNCITLCYTCHKVVHKLPDCGYSELSCKNKKN